MNNFKGGGFKKGGSKFSGINKFGGDRKHGGGHNRKHHSTNSTAEMFVATCSECHKKCEVPFKPSSDKPVYCSTCFGVKKNANESSGSFSERDRSDRGPHNEALNHTKASRVERSPRHDSIQGLSNDDIAGLKRQISGLESKLNRILELINPPMHSQKAPVPIKEKEITEIIKATPKVVTKKVAKKTPVKKTVKKVAKKAVKKVAKKAKK